MGYRVQGYGANVWAMRYRGMRHIGNWVQSAMGHIGNGAQSAMGTGGMGTWATGHMQQ